MLSESNFLILDEPTNHLDIMSKEILEDALNHYEGTVLYVSHDRYFINRTAHRILDLSERTLTNYLGNYDYYLEKRTQAAADSASASSAAVMPAADKESKQEWKNQRQQQAQKRKLENDLKKTEHAIEALESRNEELDALMALPENCTDAAKLAALSREKEENTAKLEELYTEWETLSEKAED